MDLLEDSPSTEPKDPQLINRPTAKEKKALGIGALLFAGAAAGYVLFTTSGKLLLKMINKSTK